MNPGKWFFRWLILLVISCCSTVALAENTIRMKVIEQDEITKQEPAAPVDQGLCLFQDDLSKGPMSYWVQWTIPQRDISDIFFQGGYISDPASEGYTRGKLVTSTINPTIVSWWSPGTEFYEVCNSSGVCELQDDPSGAWSFWAQRTTPASDASTIIHKGVYYSPTSKGISRGQAKVLSGTSSITNWYANDAKFYESCFKEDPALLLGYTYIPSGAEVGKYFSFDLSQNLTIKGTHSTPVLWELVNVPSSSGLSINPSTGVISGTPVDGADQLGISGLQVRVSTKEAATTTNYQFSIIDRRLKNIVSVQNNNGYGCALTTMGALKCWGGGPSAPYYLHASDVAGLDSGVVNFSVGKMFICGVMNTGGVKCRGANNNGELGDGAYSKDETPGYISNVINLDQPVTKITSMYAHSCVIDASGGVKCWGASSQGQSGTSNWTTAPISVTGLSSGVVSVSTGYSHTCALMQGGNVKCWGSNIRGALGIGTSYQTPIHTTPVDVTVVSTVAKVVAGFGETCVVTLSGGAKCWGANYNGQLGNGSSAASGPDLMPGDSLTPVDVIGLESGVVDIGLGMGFGCALLQNGNVKCWGANDAGQLGNGTQASSLTPVDVVGINSEATSLSVTYDYACVTLKNTMAKCWGLQYGLGALPSGNPENTFVPEYVNEFRW